MKWSSNHNLRDGKKGLSSRQLQRRGKQWGEGLSWVETCENKGGGEDRGALARGGVRFRNSKLIGAI